MNLPFPPYLPPAARVALGMAPWSPFASAHLAAPPVQNPAWNPSPLGVLTALQARPIARHPTVIYTVRPGDSTSTIAGLFGTTTTQLTALNRHKLRTRIAGKPVFANLAIGEKLYVPGPVRSPLGNLTNAVGWPTDTCPDGATPNPFSSGCTDENGNPVDATGGTIVPVTGVNPVDPGTPLPQPVVICPTGQHHDSSFPFGCIPDDTMSQCASVTCGPNQTVNFNVTAGQPCCLCSDGSAPDASGNCPAPATSCGPNSTQDANGVCNCNPNYVSDPNNPGSCVLDPNQTTPGVCRAPLVYSSTNNQCFPCDPGTEVYNPTTQNCDPISHPSCGKNQVWNMDSNKCVNLCPGGAAIKTDGTCPDGSQPVQPATPAKVTPLPPPVTSCTAPLVLKNGACVSPSAAPPTSSSNTWLYVGAALAAAAVLGGVYLYTKPKTDDGAPEALSALAPA